MEGVWNGAYSKETKRMTVRGRVKRARPSPATTVCVCGLLDDMRVTVVLNIFSKLSVVHGIFRPKMSSLREKI